jgi:hypothetical protein
MSRLYHAARTIRAGIDLDLHWLRGPMGTSHISNYNSTYYNSQAPLLQKKTYRAVPPVSSNPNTPEVSCGWHVTDADHRRGG